MITNRKVLSVSEASKYIEGKSSNEEKMRSFIKKFSIIKVKDAEELRKKLEGLDLMKMKQEQICKIIDILPEDAEELNKIFAGIGLDEDETKKILETIKEYR